MPSQSTVMPVSDCSPSSGYSTVSGKSTDRDRKHCLDMPRAALDQLTNTLWMPPSVNIVNPEKSWLKVQELQIRGLDETLRRPTKILDRLTAHYDNRRHPSKVAHLCYSHRDLDPRLVRQIMLLIAREFTQRTDRFRRWRKRTAYSDRLVAWLDRMDAATALWIGQDTFHAVFGYGRGTPVVAVESGCEACILSVVGGRPQMLADLRANLRARRHHYPRQGRTEPRLRPIVESWIAQFDDETSKAICELADVLSDEVDILNEDIKQQKEERARIRAEAGKLPYEPRHRQPQRERKDKILPEPHQPAINRFSDYSSLPGYVSDVEIPVQDEPVSIYELPATTIDYGNREDDNEDEDGDSTGNESWDWLNGRMRGRGLTPQYRREVLRNVHPALSEYGPGSTVLPPLDMGMVPSRRSSWVTMTIHTEDESELGLDENRPEARSTQPIPWIAEPEPDWRYPPSEQRRAASSVWSEEDGAGAYISARQDWNKSRPIKKRDPIPPSSSVYSSHPGFRRGQNSTIR
ncbi:hypothetical protein G7Z17_g3490 [Cylindrodendrum hubeiense]|uniref:Uncharacterized protein n=1 Tax=Cylindrodendrum hubeiense TaxID=595255 RepID=A0A9P5HAP1_9HYPO|nr:hypothetical protein G7Z17_g3490 [Cylindrodendrum hubeiense]